MSKNSETSDGLSKEDHNDLDRMIADTLQIGRKNTTKGTAEEESGALPECPDEAGTSSTTMPEVS